jgi:nitroreductase
MNLTETINSRRSIRKYKPNTQIDREVVLDLIRTAQLAPSWKNSQTARYYVVMSPQKVAKVRSTCLPEFNQKNSANAPVLIVTAFEKAHSGFDNNKEPINELGDKWGAYDLGLQNQLLILQAREHNLDTLIMGIRDEKALRKELSIPNTQDVVAVIALGYRDIDPEMPKRKEIEEITNIF